MSQKFILRCEAPEDLAPDREGRAVRHQILRVFAAQDKVL
jgi:hypothetical protein